MINRVKVSDGDMVLVTVGGEVSSHGIERIRDNIKKWLVGRGLTNVELGVLSSIGGEGISIDVLSVNDVFDEAVLNERTNR